MTKLSLCFIAKNEEEVLERCLDSFKDIADEIVFVDTGSTDRTVELARKYTDKIFYFKWIGDFAAARNFSLSKAKYEYVMWADLDDILLPSERDKLIALKSNLTKDFYLMTYDYMQDGNGKSMCLLERERIIRNDPRFKFKYPIHECIAITGSVERVPITITHKRTHAGYSSDQGRNIKMLEASLANPEYKSDPRVRYYLAKEYHDWNRIGGAVENYEKFIAMPGAYYDDYISAHFRLADCYHTLSLDEKGEPDKNKRLEYREKAKHWAFECIKKDYRWAEPYYTLGVISWDEQDWKKAIHWFEICRRMPKPDVWAPIKTDTYTWLPNLQLCVMYSNVGDFQKAYECNTEAMKYNPNDSRILHNDKLLRDMLKIKPTETKVVEVIPVKKREGLKIGWLAANASLEAPQYRIRTYNVSKWLSEHGCQSDIISAEQIPEYDVIICTRNASDYQSMLQAKKLGKRVILDLCEALFEFGWSDYVGSIEEADVVTCCSHKLAEMVLTKTKQKNVRIIEDAVESFDLNCKYEDKEQLNIGWIGVGGGWGAKYIEQLRPIITSLGHKLITIHGHVDADILWNLNTWQQELAKCDVAIVSANVELQPAKSNNRLTTCMALGLPVVASPLPAYKSIIKHGENGFIFENDEQLKDCLLALKSSEARKRIGQAGKTTSREYCIDNIGKKWQEVLSVNQSDKIVDIIIPTYKNIKYLKECLLSIKACTRHPYKVIVVNGGGQDETSELMVKEFSEFTCINTEKRVNFSEANNIGIKNSKSPYVCLMNDDIIVSQNWLLPMVEQIKGEIGFCNPLSNCDKGWLHDYDLVVDGVSLLPGVHKIENINSKSIYDLKSPSVKSYTRAWVPFFCTVMSREVIDKIGLLDESFHNGCEDLDYCTRANKLGYICAVNEASFIFHFGAISRKAQEVDKHNNDRIQSKYNKPLIVIQTGWAYEPWTSENVTRGGIGGSETAAARLAEEMAKKGFRVVVFGVNNEKGRIISDVEWWDNQFWQQFIDTNWIDILLVSRYVEFLDHNVRCGKSFLWIHDIFALGDKNAVRKHYEKLSGILCLSPWHVNFFAEYHGIPKDKIILFGNAIDLDRFEQ